MFGIVQAKQVLLMVGRRGRDCSHLEKKGMESMYVHCFNCSMVCPYALAQPEH